MSPRRDGCSATPLGLLIALSDSGAGAFRDKPLRAVVQPHHTGGVSESERDSHGRTDLHSVVVESGVGRADDLRTGALDNENLRTVKAPIVACRDVSRDQDRDTCESDSVSYSGAVEQADIGTRGEWLRLDNVRATSGAKMKTDSSAPSARAAAFASWKASRDVRVTVPVSTTLIPAPRTKSRPRVWDCRPRNFDWPPSAQLDGRA